jgi:predicted nucleotidyltransferase
MEYNLKDHISPPVLEAFCKKFGVRRLSLFGSAQRGELGPESDVDILVYFEEGRTPGLFDLSRMEIELTGMLGRKVDLRTPAELSRYFREEVVRSSEVQYEAA